MILSLNEATEILHLDGGHNDARVRALIEALPSYLYHATGYQATGEYSPVAKTAARFILWQWYYGENAGTDKVQRVIDCLLKALSAERALP